MTYLVSPSSVVVVTSVASRGSGGSRSNALLRHMDPNSMDRVGTAAVGLLLGNTNKTCLLQQSFEEDTHTQKKKREKKKTRIKKKITHEGQMDVHVWRSLMNGA